MHHKREAVWNTHTQNEQGCVLPLLHHLENVFHLQIFVWMILPHTQSQ